MLDDAEDRRHQRMHERGIPESREASSHPTFENQNGLPEPEQVG